MSWEYAELSKAASKAGGAEKYVETLIQSGKNTGRKEMLPLVLLSCLAGMGINWAIQKYKEKKNKDLEEMEIAKYALINGINEAESVDILIKNEGIDDESDDNEEMQE